MTPSRTWDRFRADRARVEEILSGLLPTGSPRVSEAVRYALEGGGKRIRPVLCVAAYRAVRGDVPDAVYQLASALELIHTYSLMHDDLPSMDDDPVRRGRPSTHVALGVPTATVAGAAMIPMAMAAASESSEMLGLDQGRRMAVVAALCAAAGGGGMVGGQLLDLEAEGSDIGVMALERIHGMKTGALLGAGPLLGGMAAEAEGVVLDALEVYGRSLGLAFQIVDDILDVTGTTRDLGKTPGRDTELGKATFPALMGLEEARDRAAEEVRVAQSAVRAVGLDSSELDALARYAIERDR
ncbi:MAG TPA: farnesyl diphosphate synthase [Longimicrobiales bacterium]|nr:farnesyl diphosphate synthase [Longimicrobiales bacterium]